MKRFLKSGGVLESAVPSLLLGCGMVSLAVLLFSAASPTAQVLSGLTAFCLTALWWMLLRQQRTSRETQQSLGCFREETMSRRSTMRFIFDELLDDTVGLRSEVLRTRRQLRTSLNVASGFLELLYEEAIPASEGPSGRYINEARQAVARSCELAAELGRKIPVLDQNLPAAAASENSRTVSARNLL